MVASSMLPFFAGRCQDSGVILTGRLIVTCCLAESIVGIGLSCLDDGGAGNDP